MFKEETFVVAYCQVTPVNVSLRFTDVRLPPKMPPVKKEKKLPVVLSKQECKELFKAPRTLKHRFLLAFAYAGGLRMNELRLLRLTAIDLQRGQVLIRQGKGRKDRYVGLSKLIAQKLPAYLSEAKPGCMCLKGLRPPSRWANAAYSM